MKVSWKALTPIFADVVISPWNLLVGGLLIKNLSAINSLFSIIFGYLILCLIFVIYGGLGYIKRKQSSEILTGIFKSKIIYYLVPLILALGQLGWAAINMDLGGRSLATILFINQNIGIVIYGLILLLMALLNLNRLGIVKAFIVFSSIGLLVYLFINKLTYTPFSKFIIYQPTSEKSLFWGVSVVIASLISFSTISPDFFQSIKTKKDIILSTTFGLLIPGVFTALLGCFLFFDRNNFNLIALISSLSFPFFPHLFNMTTNTDGAVALFTPGLKFVHMFKTSLKKGIFLGFLFSLVLAFMNISAYLEIWLKFLSIFFPAFIGICFPALFFKEMFKKKEYQINISLSFVITILITLVLSRYFPSVILALVSPLLISSLLLSYAKIKIL